MLTVNVNVTFNLFECGFVLDERQEIDEHYALESYA